MKTFTYVRYPEDEEFIWQREEDEEPDFEVDEEKLSDLCWQKYLNDEYECDSVYSAEEEDHLDIYVFTLTEQELKTI